MSTTEPFENLQELTHHRGTPRRRGLLRIRERVIRLALLGCAVFSVVTTAAIIVVLANETLSFFATNTSDVRAGEVRVPLDSVDPRQAELLTGWNLEVPGSPGAALPSGSFLAIQDDRDRSILVPVSQLEDERTNTSGDDPRAALAGLLDRSGPDGELELTGWVEDGPRRPEVGFGEFITGTEWNPLLGEEKQFGIWPLITGTLLITAIAAVFALPIGLVTAIFLSEYAPMRVRNVVKPILEILAGVPTVVFGFFALTVLTPGLNWLGGVYNSLLEGTLAFDTYNAMAAGLAVGIMILPIVTSLAEDALRSVPKALRDGAFALGATRFDVSTRVVVPAALSGIMASFLLAITRAVGETMIVALAAGGLAQMAYDPTGPAQTMTAYMVQIFLGDAPATGVEYKSSYAVAAVLFLMTLVLTIAGNLILNRFREEYE